jgi:hypothetical protein
MTTRPSPLEAIGFRRARHWSVTAAFVLLALALGPIAAGCGGDAGSASGGHAGDDKAQTVDEGGRKLPGTKEFGLTEEEFAAHVEKVQALIAECMTQAGFEYIPADVKTIELAQSAVRVEPGYTREEYKKRWGYGVSTRFDNVVKEIELGPQNLRYIEGLSEADREAYERTLYGEDPDATFAFTFDEEDFSTTGGCTRKAVEQVFTKEQLSENYQHPKDVLIEKDPRVLEANANWVACMQRHGYDGYLDQDEIIEEFEERFDALVGEEDPRTLTGAKLQSLKQMQREEIAISLADLDCQIKHLDKVIRDVEIEIFGVPVSG